MYLHWVLALGQGDTDTTRLSPDVIAAIHQRIVDNRYRYDDPLPDDRLDNLWFWSENHIIINLVLEYLAGSSATRMTRPSPSPASPVPSTWPNGPSPTSSSGCASAASSASSSGTATSTCSRTSRRCTCWPSWPTTPSWCRPPRWPRPVRARHGGAHRRPAATPRRAAARTRRTSCRRSTRTRSDSAKFLFDDTDRRATSRRPTAAPPSCAATRYRPPQLLVDIAIDDQESVVRERHGVFLDYERAAGGRPGRPTARTSPTARTCRSGGASGPGHVADGRTGWQEADRPQAVGHRAVRAGQADRRHQRQRPES
jgi:hypothetical protein